MGDGPWQKAAMPKEEKRQLEEPQTVRSYPGRLGSGADLEWERTTGTNGGPSVSVGFLLCTMQPDGSAVSFFWPQSMLLPIHFMPHSLLLLH